MRHVNEPPNTGPNGGVHHIFRPLEMNPLKRHALLGIFLDDADQMNHRIASGDAVIDAAGENRSPRTMRTRSAPAWSWPR